MKVSLQITLSVPEQKKKTKKKHPAYQHVEVGLDGREERCRQCEKVNKSHTSAPIELKVGGRKSKRTESG